MGFNSGFKGLSKIKFCNSLAPCPSLNYASVLARFYGTNYYKPFEFFSPIALRLDSGSWFPLKGFRDHVLLDTLHSVGLLWTSDQPDADTST